MDEPWKHGAEKVIIENHILCDSVSMTCPEEENP